MSRKKEPEPEKPKQSWQDRFREDRQTSLDAAMSWARNIDRFVREEQLDRARTSLISACETIAKLGRPEDHAVAVRCLARLDELGVGPDPMFSKWRERLGAHAAVGVEVRDAPADLDFTQPNDWRDL